MSRMFGWLFGAASLALVAAGSATAADLPTKMYTKAPPAPQDYNWNGFYVGFNVGGSWGRQQTSQVVGGVTSSINADAFPTGWIYGGQVGYNFEANHWVFGVEADYQGANQTDSEPLVTTTTPITGGYTDKISSFGTVRGRVGYATGDHGNLLPYLTGGWAYARGSISGTT